MSRVVFDADELRRVAVKIGALRESLLAAESVNAAEIAGSMLCIAGRRRT